VNDQTANTTSIENVYILSFPETLKPAFEGIIAAIGKKKNGQAQKACEEYVAATPELKTHLEKLFDANPNVPMMLESQCGVFLDEGLRRVYGMKKSAHVIAKALSPSMFKYHVEAWSKLPKQEPEQIQLPTATETTEVLAEQASEIQAELAEPVVGPIEAIVTQPEVEVVTPVIPIPNLTNDQKAEIVDAAMQAEGTPIEGTKEEKAAIFDAATADMPVNPINPPTTPVGITKEVKVTETPNKTKTPFFGITAELVNEHAGMFLVTTGLAIYERAYHYHAATVNAKAEHDALPKEKQSYARAAVNVVTRSVTFVAEKLAGTALWTVCRAHDLAGLAWKATKAIYAAAKKAVVWIWDAVRGIFVKAYDFAAGFTSSLFAKTPDAAPAAAPQA